MAEEGPGARRLSPHNKDPSLVTSYLPPNLQKAPCHPSKAPAPAACAAARRDKGGCGGLPPPLAPRLDPPRPSRSADAQQLRVLGAACRCSPRRVGRGKPHVSLSHPNFFSLPPSQGLPTRCPPASHRAQTQVPGSARRRSQPARIPRQVHLCLRRPAPPSPPTGRAQRVPPGAAPGGGAGGGSR